MLVAFTDSDGSLKTVNLNTSTNFFMNMVSNLIQYKPAKYLELKLQNCLDIRGLNATSVVFPTTSFEQLQNCSFSKHDSSARFIKNIILHFQKKYFSPRKYTPVIYESHFTLGSLILKTVTTSNIIGFSYSDRTSFVIGFAPNDLLAKSEESGSRQNINIQKIPTIYFSLKKAEYLTIDEIEAKRTFSNVIIAEEDLCKLPSQRYFIAERKSGPKGLIVSDDLGTLTGKALINKCNKFYQDRCTDTEKKITNMEEIDFPKYIELTKHCGFIFRI